MNEGRELRDAGRTKGLGSQSHRAKGTDKRPNYWCFGPVSVNNASQPLGEKTCQAIHIVEESTRNTVSSVDSHKHAEIDCIQGPYERRPAPNTHSIRTIDPQH